MGAAHTATVTVCICIIHSTSEGLLIGLVGGSQKPPVKGRGGHNYHRRHNNVGIEIISFMLAWDISDRLVYPSGEQAGLQTNVISYNHVHHVQSSLGAMHSEFVLKSSCTN